MTEPIQVPLESICSSCGKTDKSEWNEGCPNEWHKEEWERLQKENVKLREALKWALPFAEEAPDPTRSEDDVPSPEWAQNKSEARALLEGE